VVDPNQFVVGKRRLGVTVKRLEVGVGGGGIEVGVLFLNIFAVISLLIGQTEKAFLQVRVAFIPKSQCKTEASFPVGEAQQSILPPAISATAGLIVGKIGPSRTVGRIIFPYGSPLALGEIGSPAFSILDAVGILGQALLLGIHGEADLSAARISGTFGFV